MFAAFIGSVCVLQMIVGGGRSHNVENMFNAFIPSFNL